MRVLVSSKIIICTVILMHFSSIRLFGQFDNDYTPIKYTADFPKELTVDMISETESQIKNDDRLQEDAAKRFYQSLAQTKYDLFHSGQVYFKGPINDYLNEISDRLLSSDRELRNKINIYVTRLGSTNAFALPDGSIFINIGLFNVVENEHQLAFILAHEIAHFEKQHAVKSAAKADEIKKSDQHTYNPKGTLFKRLKLSRKDESEADSRGLEILKRSSYNIDEAPFALKHLQNDSIIISDSITSKLKKLLETEEVSFDSSVFEKKVNTVQKENILLSGSEDLHKTHPNIDKRMIALSELIQLNKENSPSEASTYEPDNEKFQRIKLMASLETVKNTHDNAEYLSSLFLTISLIDQLPENKFLKTYLLKNLYWLSYYSEIDKLDNVSKKSLPIRSVDYDTTASLIYSINHNDLKKVSFFYAKSVLEELSDYEEFYIYYAKLTELYLGIESAKVIYNNYLNRFDHGNYKQLALSKTK